VAAARAQRRAERNEVTMSRKPSAAAAKAGAGALLRAGMRRAGRRATTALRLRGWEPAGASHSEDLLGVVEEFNLVELHGWVLVPPDAPPVRITLHLEGLQIAGTWATETTDREGGEEIRGFRLMLRDAWQFARVRHRFTVRANSEPLPIVGHGMCLRPEEDGPRALGTLAAKLSSGWVFSRVGVLQLSKKLDTEWQRRILDYYAAMQATVKREIGHDLFAMYGSLLGAVREGSFIGHDDDFDVAVLLPVSTAEQACAELKKMAFVLIEAGYEVQAMRSALHVYASAARELRIDIFHLYFGSDGVLKFPFGAAGTKDFRRAQWQGVVEAPFGVGRVLVPANAEALTETIYGSDWRLPTPGFDWDRDRKVRASEALLPFNDREEIYWANFYAKTEYTSGSTFFEAVNDRPDCPDHIVDIGCGDGRDSFAFGKAGRFVTGLDRSHIGVRHAVKKAAELGIGGRVGFSACDVSDTVALRRVLTAAQQRAGDAPVLYYARFFLHSIAPEVQDTLMAGIHALARPGDMFAAEFRTTADKSLSKVHGKHYRRFQDGPAFGISLKESYGFEAVFEVESTGLSPYRGEDPVLYRVIAVRA